MSDRKLRWGLLSTAKINRALIPPIRASARGELVAVASRSPAKAEAYAKEWNIPKFYGSYEALLATDDVDVVYLSLPNGMHAEWTVKSVQAGKHVLVEKPFALTTQEVYAMADAAHQAGRVIAEAFMYRHHPQTLKVKQLVDEGVIGETMWVRSTFTYRLTREVDPRLDPELGGGSLWDVGCYPVSFAQNIFGGQPVRVVGCQTLDQTGIDGSFIGMMDYGSGRFAHFDCSFHSPLRAYVEIVGSAGSITVTEPFKPDSNGRLIVRREDHPEEVIKPAERPLYEGEVEDMHDAILLGAPSRVTLNETRLHIATIQALYESARRGQPVYTDV